MFRISQIDGPFVLCVRVCVCLCVCVCVRERGGGGCECDGMCKFNNSISIYKLHLSDIMRMANNCECMCVCVSVCKR